MKCVKCGKTARPALLSLEGAKVSGWKCSCGEQYLNSEVVETLLAKRQLDLLDELTSSSNASDKDVEALATRIKKDVADWHEKQAPFQNLFGIAKGKLAHSSQELKDWVRENELD